MFRQITPAWVNKPSVGTYIRVWRWVTSQLHTSTVFTYLHMCVEVGRFSITHKYSIYIRTCVWRWDASQLHTSTVWTYIHTCVEVRVSTPMRRVTAILPQLPATRNMRRNEEHTIREFERSSMAHSPPLFSQLQGALASCPSVLQKIGSPHQWEAAAIIWHDNGMDPLLPEFFLVAISDHMPTRLQIFLSPPSQSLRPPNWCDHKGRGGNRQYIAVDKSCDLCLFLHCLLFIECMEVGRFSITHKYSMYIHTYVCGGGTLLNYTQVQYLHTYICVWRWDASQLHTSTVRTYINTQGRRTLRQQS